MVREYGRDRDWPEHRRAMDDRNERRDFGQVDYSKDYEYDPQSRTGRRVEEARPRGDDYGQADYSNDWAYDPERGQPYRRFSSDDREVHRDDHPRDRTDSPSRSWKDRAGEFLGGRPRDDRQAHDPREGGRSRRDGPSDRVLWAVIMERLDDERGLDLRDVEVVVHDGEVTLNGSVRRKADKRRIEDIADVDGVRNVQNNLRPRDADRRHGLF